MARNVLQAVSFCSQARKRELRDWNSSQDDVQRWNAGWLTDDDAQTKADERWKSCFQLFHSALFLYVESGGTRTGKCGVAVLCGGERRISSEPDEPAKNSASITAATVPMCTETNERVVEKSRDEFLIYGDDFPRIAPTAAGEIEGGSSIRALRIPCTNRKTMFPQKVIICARNEAALEWKRMFD